MNIELACDAETAALLVDAIHALHNHPVKVVRGPEWIGETIRATTDEQRTRATAQLLAAAHNPYRDGPIRIHIHGNAITGLESHISYRYHALAKSARSKPKH